MGENILHDRKNFSHPLIVKKQEIFRNIKEIIA